MGTTAELVLVDFHGDTLEAVKADGKAWVSLRRCCECLGVDVESQRKKLAAKSWATAAEITAVAQDGKQRELTMIDLKTLSMWLATIDERKVAAAVRTKLVRYQSECATVLERHFFPKPADDKVRPVADIDLELLIQQQESNLAVMRSLQLTRRQLTAVETEVEDVRTVAEQASRRATAALQTAEQNCGWFTVLGYANLTGRRITREEAARAGRVISRRMRLAGMTKQTAVDTRYGHVGQYPEKMLERYFDDLDAGFYE